MDRSQSTPSAAEAVVESASTRDRIQALERELDAIPSSVLPFDPERRRRWFQAMRELSYLRGDAGLPRL